MHTDKGFSHQFTEALLQWNRTENHRQMPWKGEKDPYKIWLSEIILQQTRVEQGLKYYERFIKTFPTIQDLAAAPDQQVFKLWEGLGYYSRCKNLLEAARFIANDLQGVFPNQYEDILKLKGVGSYTAAAIASFAFNQPYAVLDGNVFRVLARIYDIEEPIDTTNGKKNFSRLAGLQLSREQPGIYNQAIMDFGATICKPFPECAACFFSDRCEAFLQGKQLLLPVKEKKIAVKERWFNYVVLQHKNVIAIKKRASRDIWQNLYEFPLIETSGPASLKEIHLQLEKGFGFSHHDVIFKKEIFETKQRLTHQVINFSFYQAETCEVKDIPGFIWVGWEELNHYPFPKTLQEYIINN
ncbi:A/G-specific adenine glycosylase [Chitinophagaceae bacterium LB-8]|uniref:Adenine DNA glycosylase n=1 Tax=Paraflavisolibacter caeni TaxID=2982496 RepID=A0A9X2XZB4_9BACT|nr:A/G-specific adenine glycosylase [Paraflavisolibacter caeni]MCU7551637.1 A/G-specific adenine glycosylase [Paraflavisolibacter caeni]